MFGELERDLRARVRAEEEAHAKADRGSDTLWDHLERVARLAVALGRAEGVGHAGLGETGDGDDVAGNRLLDRLAPEPAEAEQLGQARLLHGLAVASVAGEGEPQLIRFLTSKPEKRGAVKGGAGVGG